MVDDAAFIQVSKALLLQILSLQDSLSAVTMLLKNKGVLTRQEYEEALRKVEQMSAERRVKIEKFGLVDLDAFLRSYEGPVQ